MNMKKLIAGVIACCVVGGAVPLVSVCDIADNAVAVDSDQVDPSLTYELNSSGAYYGITKFDNSKSSVEIPAEIDSIPVRVIVANAFQNCTKLESITIPEGVTNINDYAFSGCTSLKEINLPDTLTYIGEYAFQKCIKLENINIPDGVNTIKQYAFYQCTDLLTLEFPSGLSYISSYVAQECRNLQSVVINNGPTGIGWYSFKNCTKLKTVTLPTSIMYMNGNSKDDKYNMSFENCPVADVYYAGNAENWGIIMNTSYNFGSSTKIHYGEKSPSLYQPSGRMFGDVNGDNIIDATDASLILSYYAYTSTGGTDTLETFLESDESKQG